MNERERLIELLFDAAVKKVRICGDRKDCDGCQYEDTPRRCIQALYADFLIENGVILLPCKIGDPIYEVITCRNGSKHILRGECAGIHMRDNKGFRNITKKDYLIVRNGNSHSRHIDLDKLGVTLFTNREEAEAVVKS